MIRVRNHHGAPVCGVPNGAEGEVNETNLGVKAALAGGLLMPVGGDAPSTRSPRPVDDGDRAQFDAYAKRAAEEIESLEKERNALAAERDALRAQVAELNAALDAATKPEAKSKKGS